MEDWNREPSWNCDVLERIVALLFALASLADRAGGLPRFHRRQVLDILSHGEVEARAFLFGGAPLPTDALEEAGDATRIAMRLRALALVLCTYLAQAALFAPSGAIGPQAGRPSHEMFGLSVRRPGATAPFAPDTS